MTKCSNVMPARGIALSTAAPINGPWFSDGVITVRARGATVSCGTTTDTFLDLRAAASHSKSVTRKSAKAMFLGQHHPVLMRRNTAHPTIPESPATQTRLPRRSQDDCGNKLVDRI